MSRCFYFSLSESATARVERLSDPHELSRQANKIEENGEQRKTKKKIKIVPPK
jgi:hypothetical protein